MPAMSSSVGLLRASHWGWLGIYAALLLQCGQTTAWFSGGLLLISLGLGWRRRRQLQTLRRTPLTLGLLALLASLGLLAKGHGLSLDIGLELASGLLLLKALEARQARDFGVLAGLTCFVSMASLLSNQSLSHCLLAGISLLAPLACLRATHETTTPAQPLWRDALNSSGLLLASLPLTLLCFIAIPRLSSPLWGHGGLEPSHVSGLSEHLSAADFNQVIQDDSPALRVSFNGQPPAAAQRYFRGYVFWRFDGHDWSRSAPLASRPSPSATITTQPRLNYEAIMEPDGQSQLPVLDWPLGPVQGVNAQLDADGSLQRERAVDHPVRYALAARLSPPQTSLSPAQRAAGLQWPAQAAARTRTLGQQWQAQQRSPRAIAAQALNLFQTGGFSYSLQPPPVAGDPTDDFLFDTRRGYCVHFASAFVLLMRAAGIPARVVSGYQGGYWNPLGDYLLIRHADAHAWAEIWSQPDQQWLRYDPTAVVSQRKIANDNSGRDGSDPGSAAGWLSNLGNPWDWVNQVWNRSVVGYDQTQQHRLFQPHPAASSPIFTLRYGLWLGFLLGFGLLALSWGLRHHQSIEPMQLAWLQLQQHFKRQGLALLPGEGPASYLQRAADTFPSQRKEIERLTKLYLVVRYADSHPRPEHILGLQRALRNFRRLKLSNHR